MSRYTVNTEYFSFLTQESAYWAGFIAADGCVIARNTGLRAVRIELASRDRSHLKEFITNVNYTGPIYEKIRHQWGKECSLCTLQISGVRTWIDDLFRFYNITPRKSITLTPPNIEDEFFILPYIIGYLDGDGSIYNVFSKERNTPYIRLSFVGTKKFLLWIKKNLDRLSSDKSKANVRAVKDRNTFEYSITGKRARHILLTLKEVPVPHLERKWDKV